MTIAPALQRIETELKQLAEEAKAAPIDSYRLVTLARQVAAQREMIEQGLVG